MDFEEQKEIQNSEIVIDYFGYWPSFHDAEILSIKFERYWDKNNSFIEMTVYAFEATSNIIDGYYELVKHCIIEFEFISIGGNSIDGFNHQNAVMELHFGRKDDYLSCKISSAYGVDGYIEAKEVRVKKLELVRK